jgi:hypothetical protein
MPVLRKSAPREKAVRRPPPSGRERVGGEEGGEAHRVESRLKVITLAEWVNIRIAQEVEARDLAFSSGLADQLHRPVAEPPYLGGIRGGSVLGDRSARGGQSVQLGQAGGQVAVIEGDGTRHRLDDRAGFPECGHGLGGPAGPAEQASSYRVARTRPRVSRLSARLARWDMG